MRAHDLRSACFLTLLSSHAGSALAEGSSMCSVHSGAAVPTIIELYTSEGCSSCPPADRWFSQLKSDAGVIGLAFHVDYWDGLGWKDRFASSTFTARQAQLQKRSNARFSYTPQIVLNGVDYPRWRELRLPLSAHTASGSAVQMTIARHGDSYAANVIALEGAPERLEAFWALTEDGFSTSVRAGENHGATLIHDLVVREYSPIAAWSSESLRQRTFNFSPRTRENPAHRRLVNLVIVDSKTGQPVQALRIGC